MLYYIHTSELKRNLNTLSLLNVIDVIRLELLPADFPLLLKNRLVLKGNLNDIDRLFTSC